MNKKLFKFQAIVLLVFVFLVTSCNHKNNGTIPVAKDGVLDLRIWDLDRDGIVELKGEWEFYWGKLLTPEDFKKTNLPEKSGIIRVPENWNKFLVNNKKIGSDGYATYRLYVLLNDKNKRLSIKLYEIASAYRMYINNKLIASCGKVGITRESMIPQGMPLIEVFESDSNELSIIIQVSNFHDTNGGILYSAPYLGNIESIKKKNNQELFIQILLFGGILIIALYHFSLFILQKKNLSLLAFSLICIVIDFMMLTFTNIHLIYIFYDINWFFTKRVSYILVYICIIFFHIFIFYTFEKIYSKKIYIAFLLSYSVPIAISIFSPLEICAAVFFIFQILILISLLYTIYKIIQSMVRRHVFTESLLFLIGLIIVAISAINDILLFNQIIVTDIMMIPIGFLLFIITQSIILSIKFSKAYKNVEDYSKQLEDYSRNLEQKVKDRTLRLEKATQEKTNFFINIAHETKTPLTLINNYLNKFIDKYGISEELGIIKENIDKLIKDMVDFLDIERFDKGKIVYNHNQIINLSSILKNKAIIFFEYAKNKDIKIETEIETHIYAKIDPDSIDRLTNNLFDNAVKYTVNGGSIKIFLKTENNMIFLIVEDTGIGMNEEQIKNIFDPFYQASQDKKNIQGIGIGLSIVKRIVDNINGKIIIESKMNEGTKFTIIMDKYTLKDTDVIRENIEYTLPTGFETKSKMLQEKKYVKGKYCIYIIDDNLDMLSYLIDEIKNDYNVYFASNGQEALNKIVKIPKPDLIISDIMMDIMDGYEFYGRLNEREEYNDIPFIFLTAKTSMDEKIKGLSMGAIDYVLKPFNISELLLKIESIIKNNKAVRKFIKIKTVKNVKEMIRKNKNVIFEKTCLRLKITNKEKQIIELLLDGKLNKEISAILKISFHTIRNHVKNIYLKCGVQNRVELINAFKKTDI